MRLQRPGSATRTAWQPPVRTRREQNFGTGSGMRFQNEFAERSQAMNRATISICYHGWGGRNRTSAWRNQNPIGFAVKSTSILKNSENSPLDASITWLQFQNGARPNERANGPHRGDRVAHQYARDNFVKPPWGGMNSGCLRFISATPFAAPYGGRRDMRLEF